MTNCLHTGGSVGFDQYYEEIAKKQKHSIKLYHFDGHKNTRVEVIEPNPVSHSVSHSHSHYEPLELASKKLNRNLPKTGYERHLLERDYFLVTKSKATSLYATGFMKNGIISGGTGFIVELFIDHNPTLPIYFHCIESGINYTMTHSGWQTIDHFPTPSENWIGVGSRKASTN